MRNEGLPIFLVNLGCVGAVATSYESASTFLFFEWKNLYLEEKFVETYHFLLYLTWKMFINIKGK